RDARRAGDLRQRLRPQRGRRAHRVGADRAFADFAATPRRRSQRVACARREDGFPGRLHPGAHPLGRSAAHRPLRGARSAAGRAGGVNQRRSEAGGAARYVTYKTVETSYMSIADPNKTILTGENPFIRLSLKDGDPNSTDASYWRIIFSPAGPGHVLYLKSELTEGRWRIYSDNIAMARWLQTTVQGMLNAELSDTTIACAEAT